MDTLSQTMRRYLGIVLTTFFALCGIGCHHSYFVVEVASGAQLSPQWTTIRPAHLLPWSHPIEELSFHIDSPHAIGRSAELIMPSGMHCSIEVQLVSADGHAYSMVWHNFLNGDMFFGLPQKPPTLNIVQGFRIRSSFPIKVSNLIWRGYDPKTGMR